MESIHIFLYLVANRKIMMKKYNKKRREFLKHSGKFLASAVAASAWTPLMAKTPQNKGEMIMQTWYITGASGGLGFELAKYLLEKGDKVALTSRKISNLKDKFGSENENMLFLELQFNKNLNKQIEQNMQSIKAKFNRLDNVVNNAGYGLLGFVEEVSEKSLREQFEVNVFAPFLITQNALKIMRPQSKNEGGNKENVRGRIFNLSSIGGFRVSNTSTPYCMSKFAISAMSEGLNLDLEDFGIRAINIMPAGFRTQFLGTSMKLGDIKIKDYDAKREAFLQNSANYSGKQAGNPAAFAKVIYEISRLKNPPLYLFMGEAAYNSAKNKIALVESDMKKTQSYAGAAVDFEDAKGSVFDKR